MTVRRFTEAGRACIDSNNLYGGLALALMLPDICSSIVEPGTKNSQQRYKNWCKQWVEPRFTYSPGGTQTVFVNAEDLYQIRCSFLHSGRSDINPEKIKDVRSFEFFDETDGSHLNRYLLNVNGKDYSFLQLKVSEFSLTIFDAADEWETATSADPAVKQQNESLMTIHSKGARLAGGLVAF
jgi:hypothetical protein